ncbi:MAG: alpha/beta fold hydrolase, partial [Solirubrobacterales bacterium]
MEGATASGTGSADGGMRTAVVDGARLAYREAGPPEGEPVVLLHGYPSNHRIWRHQIAALRSDHRVIAPDLLGWGDSEQPLDLRFDYDAEVERVGRMLDALGLGRVNLFAHDYGGFLALGFVQRHPDRVSRLALLNTRAQGSFVPRWYLAFGAVSVAGRIPGVRAVAARVPLAAINARALAPLQRRGAVDSELISSY